MLKVKNYFSLIKFSHTIFAMPFALIGFFLGLMKTDVISKDYLMSFTTGIHKDYQPINLSTNQLIIKFVLVLLCMVFARSAAMAFNRYLDRRIDAKNPRTAIREIPKGIITPKNALIFTIINCILFITTTFFINPICFYLSVVALAVVLGYSYTKRFTAFCHLILGLGLSLAPIGAYLAVIGRFDLLPI
ncbi:MAG TPA: UbiA family prenyltransferase, partial [Chitinophagaceae bacterium]